MLPHMHKAPKRHRFPVSIISHVVWLYHRFNHSYRDIQEQMAYRGIILSHETIRSWCYKFSSHFKNVIKKQERRPKDKWHLDEMTIRINGEYFVLWRAVDSDGYELDVFLQKRKNKKATILPVPPVAGAATVPTPAENNTPKLPTPIFTPPEARANFLSSKLGFQRSCAIFRPKESARLFSLILIRCFLLDA
jgi:putative transposase